jgi:UDPglucose 6-dehydrogenase
MDEARHLLPGSVHFADSAEHCIAGADAVVLVTEWNEFRALAPAHYLAAMKGRVMVDLRNIYAPDEMAEAGLSYSSIGR